LNPDADSRSRHPFLTFVLILTGGTTGNTKATAHMWKCHLYVHQVSVISEVVKTFAHYIKTATLII
jgi:hypothetical protein